MELPTDIVLHLRQAVKQRQSNDTTRFSWFSDDTKNNLVNLAHALEVALEQGPHAVCSLGTQESVLDEIRETYRSAALGDLFRLNLVSEEIMLEMDSFVWLEQLKASSCELPDSLLDQVAESCLDWAIASKRGGNLPECLHAHLMRMTLCPRYQITDAVRLLGLTKDCECKAGGLVVAEPIPKTALFEIKAATETNKVFQPSDRARAMGLDVRAIMKEHGFTFRNCRSFLLPLVQDAENANDPGRMFSANSFFNHRFKLPNADSKLSALEALVRLLLFGVAVERTLVENAIGKKQLESLICAGLVTTSPACSSHIVGEVQIYPISSRDLFGGNPDCDNETCFFITDWPMESLRLTRDAIMAVGEDTLELLALSADGSNASGHLLDLCCGCGIQGIFAWCCAGGGGGDYSELACTDVNERACYFVAANMALNNVGDGGRPRDKGKRVFAICGDLFQGLRRELTFSEAKCGFHRILSNPPFVAIPPHALHGLPQTAPALYAVGGGVDGTELLGRLVGESFEFLANSTVASLLMVTEVPNVESSCKLLKGFIPKDQDSCVRIAYVGRDVEPVEQYAAVRELEVHNDVSTRSWESPQQKAGVVNRALVLISITRSDRESLLFQYGEERDETQTDENGIEEEDAFLTNDGIFFARSRLLSNS